MTLTNQVLHDNSLFGFIVEDEGLSYTIKKEALHNPYVFDSLTSNGWDYIEYPYVLKNGTVRSDTLPSKTLVELNLTKMEEQELDDMLVELYPEVTIRSRIKSELKFLPLPETNYVIHTRKDFLQFLDNTYDGLISLNDLRSIIPINYFVAPNALFSVAEYLDKNNSHYREILEKRRTYNLKSFRTMQIALLQLGLSENFDSKQLTNFYFQWGVCGIRLEIFDKTSSQSSHILTINSSVYSLPSPLTYYGTGYIEAGGKICGLTTGDWKLTDSAYVLPRANDFLNMQPPGTIYPASVERQYSEFNSLWIGEDVTYEFNDVSLKITFKNKSQVIPTLRVVDSIFTRSSNLSTKFWNLISGANLYKEVAIRTAMAHITSVATIKYDVSSFKALTLMGCSPISVFKLVSTISHIYDESNDEAPPLAYNYVNGLIEQYFQDIVDTSNEHFTQISEYVIDFINGDKNIDLIQEALLNTSNNFNKTLYHTLLLAIDVLGYTINEMLEEVGTVTLEKPTIEFMRNGKRLFYEIDINRDKLLGYHADTQSYLLQKSKEVAYVIRVKRVYREMAPVGYKQRHIGILFDTICFANNPGAVTRNGSIFEPNSKLLKAYNVELAKYSSFVKQLLEQTYNPYHENYITGNNMISVYFMNSVFNVLETGYTLEVKTIGIPPYQCSQSFRDMLSLSYKDNCCESLYGLTQEVLLSGGQFWWHCVNATLLSHWVVPHKGVTLKECPFQPEWVLKGQYGVSMDTASKWYDKGWLVNPNYPGLSAYYDTNAIITHEIANLVTGMKDYVDYTLEYYFNRMKNLLTTTKDEKFTIPDLIMYEKNPLIVELLGSDYEMNESQLSTVRAYSQGTIVDITHELMLNRSPNLRRMFSTQQQLTSTTFIKNGLVLSLNNVVSSYKTIKAIFHIFPEDKIKAQYIHNRETVLFANGEYIRACDFNKSNLEQFAVLPLSESSYLVEDIYGRQYTVFI